MSNLTILIRILLAAFLGGLVGIEREIHGRAAGLRTHILVSTGAALFTITSISIALSYGRLGAADPSRIAAQVVTGIGFLGAGAIIRYGASIRGLTTAASIWAVSAIGLAVGAGMYGAAGITTFVVIMVLVLSRLEERMELKGYARRMEITLDLSVETNVDSIRKLVEAYGGKVKLIGSSEDGGKGERKVVLDITLPRMYNREVVAELISLSGVKDAVWK